MLRGRYGSPYRPPPDGWSVPPKTFFGGLYQHLRAALNGLPKFVNNTQTQLQQNQVGSPVMRPSPAPSGGAGCESHPNNGLPQIPWIGTGNDQYRPYHLGGSLGNTYVQQGTNDLGNNALDNGRDLEKPSGVR